MFEQKFPFLFNKKLCFLALEDRNDVIGKKNLTSSSIEYL